MHRIRLAGPWRVKWHDGEPATTGAAAPDSVKMPISWEAAFGPQAGTATFLRRFHRPTNLGDERVVLELTGCNGVQGVQLNGTVVEPDSTEPTFFRADITDLLQVSNELAVTVRWHGKSRPRDETDHQGGLWGPVQLMIGD